MKISRLVPDDSGIVTWPTLSVSKKSVVTVGVFDGMHLGHQALLKRVKTLAAEQDAFSVVIMFDPRPGVIHQYALSHDGAEPRKGESLEDPLELMGIDERVRLMRQIGIDQVFIIGYSLAFAAKSYRFFLGQLVGKLGMRTLVLGADAAMGAGRAGDVKSIQTLAEATGVFELDVMDDLGPGYTRVPARIVSQQPKEEGEPTDPTVTMTKAELRAWSKAHNARRLRVWSSTNVRYLLSQGRIADANAILGHVHSIDGLVVHGEQRGRTLGFPTANMDVNTEGYVPADGVYAGWLVDLGEKAETSTDGEDASGVSAAPSVEARVAKGSPWRWPAAISIGTKETYVEQTGLNQRVVESYAVNDEWLDLYGHELRVEFEAFLRPQRRFDSSEELVEQLHKDVQSTKELTSDEGDAAE
ncbi:MAG: riboflavin kinase [Bifidobacterium crudilactis]|jgi:riboflavin kinase/FMN adenylyltransferase|uniref:bifunctional riboflavin kinase/FMN adenylyltransferase n=1 Tax=Bifidobacterium crudilactis TaxID=327277 RepID=UPI00235254A3|nr:riboflavin kinase [Bifidobacterium crudilactis]MCI1218042.1 bifunctional riboflavin kinase/FMN adenylyltransferase [Bifidobacterium crudilactis]MCI1636989.1 bifunctional riboflavin kinase/FMN adenylyltransferase [Bifidobacterium crudilactis]